MNRLLPLCALAGLLGACSSLQVTRSLSTDDQCRIINKKRMTVVRHWHNPKMNPGRNSQKMGGVAEGSGQGHVADMGQFMTSRTGRAALATAAFATAEDTMLHEVSAATQSKRRNLVRDDRLSRDERPGSKVNKTDARQFTAYRQKVTFHEDLRIAAVLGASALACIGLIVYGQSRWRRLSQWAAANPLKARGLIAGIHTITGLAALAAGNYLWEGGSVVSDRTMYVALSAFALGTILYPGRDFSLLKRTYLVRKIHDVVLFVSGAALITYAGNHYTLTNDRQLGDGKVYAAYAKWTPYQIIERVQEDATVQPEPVKKRTGLKVLLTVLAVAGFVGLTMLLAALACSISCAGYDALALLVFFGGEAGLVILLVTVIRAIFGRRKRRLQTQPSGT